MNNKSDFDTTMELTAPEVLMLSYAHKFHTGNNEFQLFWKNHYDVDPKKILDKLLAFGYIQKADIESSLKGLTVPLLKEMAQNFGLSKSGKKLDIIERIVANVPIGILNGVFPYRYYELTEKGNDILEKYPNVLFIHRNPNFELDIDYGLKDIDIYSTIEHNIDNNINYCLSRDLWGLYRNCIFQKSELCKSKKDYEAELKHLITVSYLDISGLRNGVEPRYLIDLRNFIDLSSIHKWLAPGIISRIVKIIKHLDMSLNDFEIICQNQINDTHVPFHLLSKYEACGIIFNEISELLT